LEQNLADPGVREMNTPNKDQNPWRAIGLVSAIGIDLTLFLLLGVWGGKWLDARFDLSPLFLIVGIFLGLALGILVIIRLIKQFTGE